MKHDNKEALDNFNYADANNLRMDDLGERTKATIRAALAQPEQEWQDACAMIRYLLPLAKGYVYANPGIRSTECIIEDAEAMIATTE